MRTSLTLLGRFLALAFPGEALAELAGLPVPAVLNRENAFALFTATFVFLVFIADYWPRISTLPQRTGRRWKTGQVVLEVAVARSNAYGVRRSRGVRTQVAA
jgi:hypothetical protein